MELVAWSVLCLILTATGSLHLLLVLAIAAGLGQATLYTLTGSEAALFADDVAVACFVLVASVKALVEGDPRTFKALAFLLAGGLWIAFRLASSADPVAGLPQARQVALPLGLAFAGFALRSELNWQRISGYCLWAGLLTAGWVLTEDVLQHPLLDPMAYYFSSAGSIANATARILQGYGPVPPSYVADGISNLGLPAFRPGGPYLNPPVAGLMLGLGAFGAKFRLRGSARALAVGALGAALMSSYARAGMLVFVLVVVIPWLWAKGGKSVTALVAGTGGLYVVSVFATQGGTGSHSEGLLSGAQVAITQPGGLGFGTTGFLARSAGASEAGAGSESLLGLYLAWLGLPVLAVLTWYIGTLLVRLQRMPRDQALPLWLGVALVLAAAASESTASMASTPVLWLAGGWALTLKPDEAASASLPRNGQLAKTSSGTTAV